MSTDKVRITNFLLEQLNNYQGGTNVTQKLSRGHMKYKEMRKNVLRGIVNWQTKRQSSCTKSQVLVFMTTISRRRNWNQLEDLQKLYSQIVLECLHLARIGRPRILWSANNLARPATKMDQSLWQTLGSFDFLHHTKDYRQKCHVGNLAPQCKTVAWSSDMEGHARRCVELHCELANKTMEQLHKVSSPCLDDNSNKKHLNQWENYEKCAHKARIGIPDILWSVNKLARAVRKWTQACDSRLARLISYIHHTNVFRQYGHVGTTAEHCRLGLFQDSDFAGDLEDSNWTSGWILCIVGSRTFVPISWMRNKQTSVSHSSTESEVFS